MQFTVTCTCGKKLAARDEHVGKTAKCPQCGRQFLIVRPAQQTVPRVEARDKLGDSGQEPLLPTPAASTAPLYDGQRLEHWFDLLSSADANDRRKAAEVLSGVGPEAAADLPALVARSSSPHVLVRHWATVCLGQIGPAANEALDSLLTRLNDEQPLVREKAAKAIEQIIPGSVAFVPRLMRELNRKDTDRGQAIDVFRRDLKTAGISRFRFWACTCGRVYIKIDLEERLRKAVEAPHELNWEGERVCGQCGARYQDREVYAGKHDVGEPFWPKLRAKFGKHLSVSDDFFDEAKQHAGYRISEEPGAAEQSGLPSPGSFSLNLEGIFSSGVAEGYALAEVPATVPLHEVLGTRTAAKEPELVPGSAVPKTGKYKCKTCGKRRLSSTTEAKAPLRASAVMPFKSGKTFSECPHCGELTEWEFLG